jgi:hypothetical protein
MSWFAYVLTPTALQCYSVQSNGQLNAISPPVPVPSRSKYTDGSIYAHGNKIFIALYVEPNALLSIYHVELDGTLTARVKNYKRDTGPGAAVAAMMLPGQTRPYWVMVRSTEDITCYRYDEPDTLEPAGVTPFPVSNDAVMAITVDRARRLLYAGKLSAPQDLYSFFLSTFGLLIPVGQSPDNQAETECIAAHPNGNFVYSSSYAALLRFSTDEGKFSTAFDRYPLSETSESLAIHPNGKYLFAYTRAPNVVTSYSIDPATGKLNKLGVQPCGPSAQLAMAFDGKFLYAATVSSAILCYQVDDNGTLTQKSVVNTGDTNDAMIILEVS